MKYSNSNHDMLMGFQGCRAYVLSAAGGAMLELLLQVTLAACGGCRSRVNVRPTQAVMIRTNLQHHRYRQHVQHARSLRKTEMPSIAELARARGCSKPPQSTLTEWLSFQF
jgi:hypothetical protein